jgi:hemerythrin
MTSKWSTQYLTGVKEIDEQHFTIIKKLFEIENLIRLPHSKSEILDALMFLETYSLTHFTYEERVMEEKKCSAREENKQQHAVFMQYIHSLNLKFTEGQLSDDTLISMQKELTDWVANHILQIDMQMNLQPSVGEKITENEI